MGKGEHFDPPPPYTATEFDQVNPPPSNAPQYGFVLPNAAPGVAPQPGPSQMGVPPPQVHQVIHVANPSVGPRPTTLVCPSCHKTVKTKLEYEAGSKTHLVCLLLCLLQCYLCCLLPYCVESCQNGVHSCPKCGAYIGTYSGA